MMRLIFSSIYLVIIRPARYGYAKKGVIAGTWRRCQHIHIKPAPASLARVLSAGRPSVNGDDLFIYNVLIYH